ncbi:MAG: hypothetical protein EZS28_003380 [Streblomastix strix]|uniref:TLC domain-containing protein n=1 Tax=Streblomastix strix TaxID=222440 RepID=A0A5J4X3N5_9EUKA|nr:MAG: hypothetical protein EZS28_003380 [Streblomastix strix]
MFLCMSGCIIQQNGLIPFLIMAPMFFIGRCVIFPITSIRATFLYYNIKGTPYFFLGLLEIGFYIMNLIWMKMILGMISKAAHGKLNKDTRSDDEEEMYDESGKEIEPKKD